MGNEGIYCVGEVEEEPQGNHVKVAGDSLGGLLTREPVASHLGITEFQISHV